MQTPLAISLTLVLATAGCGQQGGPPAQQSPEERVTPSADAGNAPEVDMLLEPVAAARSAHDDRVAAAQAELVLDMEFYIRELAQGGEPAVVQEAMAERDRFVERGALPYAPELEGPVAVYEQKVAQAETELAQTLRVAVEALTRELRIDEAMALQDEAERLEDSSSATLDAADQPQLAGGEERTTPPGDGNDVELFEGLGTPGDREPDDGDTDTPSDEIEPPTEPARPDPVAEQLAEDDAAYRAAIDEARQTLLDRMDTRIAALRSADEMDEAARFADEQMMFREHGLLPTHPSLQAVVRRYVIEAGRALRRFTRPCSEAVTAYYTSNEVARGKALERRLNRLRTTQAFQEAIADTRASRVPQAAYRFETGGVVTRIAVSVDGLLCCAWSRDGVMQVWSLATGEVVSRFDAPLPNVEWLTMSNDGSVIGASSGLHSGILYRSDGSVIADLNENRERNNIALSEDGQYVILGGLYWTTLQDVQALSRGQTQRLVNNHTSSYSVAINTSAGAFVSGGWENEVKVYDLESRRHTRTLVGVRQIYGLGFAPDGSHLYAVSTEKQLLIWETESYEQVQTITGLPDVPRWSSLSNDGTLICANLSRGWVFEIATGRKLYEVGEERSFHIITPNAAYILGSDGNDVVLYKLPDHE